MVSVDSDAKSDLESGLESDAGSLCFGPQVAGLSTVGPAVLHWNDITSATLHKLTFSRVTTVTTDTTDRTGIEEFIAAYLPASFGRGGVDVLDTFYRQAVKLEPTNFSTNFHPANHGILDDIRQVLLPAYCGPEGVDGTEMRIHAELYKLNIYSAPSGKFKSHMDTPR
jgi:hypothetical protein